MSSDLLPCPGCGSGQIVSDSNGDDQHWYTCNGCGLSGPTANDPIAALTPWNALPRQMVYTKTPPRVSGWYKRNDGGPNGSRFVYVYKNYGNGTYYLNLHVPTVAIKDDGTQWAGPYPEPGERKDDDDR